MQGPISNLSGAILCEAILNAANLSWAYLSGADLSNAALSGVDLTSADLDRAILKGAEGTTSEQLTQQALSLEGATMPNGQKYEDWLKSEGCRDDGENSGPS